MLATLAAKPFSDPNWLFEIKWDGYRVQAVVADGAVRIWTRNLHDAETYFPRLLTPPSWIDARQAIVDGEVVALDEAGRPDFGLLQERLGAKGAPGTRLPGLRPALSRRALAARRRARGPQAPAQERAPAAPARPLRRTRRGGRRDVPRGRGRAGSRGHRRQAPPLAVRAGPAIDGLAEDQDPSGAGAGGRRLDDGDEQRQGPRRAGRRRLRGRRAAVRRQGGLRVHRRDPQGPPRAARAADRGRSRVRPAATEGLSWPLGRRPRRRHLGPAGARHPRGAGRLVARRHGPPVRVQGRRGGAGPADGDPRKAGRHRRGGPRGRSGCAPGHGP